MNWETETFWYLASPYSKYPEGLEKAFEDVCAAACELIRHGIKVYSPIAHTHPVAIHGGEDPLDHGIWLPADLPFMDAASGLIVLKMPGWDESVGIRYEIRRFAEQLKPIRYLDFPISIAEAA